MKTWIRAAACSAAVFLCADIGHAQTSPQTSPLIIDQGRADRSPPTAPVQPSASVAGGSVAAAAAIEPFVLREVRVEGASAPASLIGAASRDYIGRTVDAAAVNRIADAVAAAYARADVALYTVLIPRQTFADGVLRLVVVEGYVERVDIQLDDPDADASAARAYAARLTQERPLRRSTLDRYLTLIRDLPGVKAEARVLQGQKPGAVQLALSLRRKRFEFGVGVNNRGTPILGRTQLQADFQINGLFRQGESTRLSLGAPTDFERFRYLALAHVEPIGRDGATLQASFARLSTRPELAGLPIKGKATMAGVQLAYPWIRGPRRSLFVSGGFDGLNSENAVFGYRFSNERIRAFRVASAFSMASERQAISASLTLSKGVDLFGAETTMPAASEVGFLKGNAQLGLNRTFGKTWIGRLAGGAQWTWDRLPPSEQYAAGGAQFGRAFSSATLLGDRGLAGSAEMAWRPAAALPKQLAGSEAYAFVDGARVWSTARPSLQDQSAGLSSTGGGVRLAIMGKAVLELEAAKGLSRSVAQSLAPGARPWRLSITARSLL